MQLLVDNRSDGLLYYDTNLSWCDISSSEWSAEKDQTVNYIYCLRVRELLLKKAFADSYNITHFSLLNWSLRQK